MFSAPPAEWIEECRQAWFEKQKMDESSASTETKQPRKTERACFYTEEELAHPAVARKKPTPAQGVPFFDRYVLAPAIAPLNHLEIMKRSGQTHHHGHHRCRKCGARTPEPKLDRRVCKHCKKEFNRTCLYEHQKWHCSKNPHRKTRTFSKKKCPHCKKLIHEKSLSRHVKTHKKKKKPQ